MITYGAEVTDPSILSKLNGDQSINSPTKYGDPVTDPSILSQLEGSPASSDNSPQQPNSLLGKWWQAIKTMNNDPYALAGNVVKSIPGIINNAPGEITGAYNQIKNNPKRVGENLVTGIGEARNSLVNIPSDVLQYGAHLGLIDPKWAEKIRATENMTDMMPQGQPAQPGDALEQAIPGLLPFVPSTLKVVKAAGETAISPWTGGRNLKELKGAANAADTEYKNAQDVENQNIAQGKVSGFPGDADVAQRKYVENQQKLQDLQQQLTENKPVLPKNVEDSKINLDNATQLHDDATQLLNNTGDSLSTHLKQGIDYDVDAASRIRSIEQANRKEISNGYSALENDWKNRDVKIDNTDKIQQTNDDLMNLIKSGESRSPEAVDLLDQLTELKNQKPTNAQDYLTAYRSASQFARDARSNAYKPGMNADDRKMWQDQYKVLDNKVDEMGQTLEDSVGSDEFQKLKDLNDRWRSEVVPLHQNRIYQNIVNNGTMSDNIIKSLRGTNKGNVIIRNIIKNDPELLKDVVGQRYAVKPSEILNPTDRTKEYTDLMPEFQKMKDQHLDAIENLNNAKENLNNAGDVHDAITKNASEYEAKREQIDKAQDELSLLDRYTANLRQFAARKNISLQQKMDIEKKLNSALKRRKAIIWGSGALGGYKAGKFLINASNYKEAGQ